MRIAEIIGKVTLSKWHPSLTGARWLVGVPLMREELTDQSKRSTEPLVIYDDIGASEGATIIMSESAEASAPFHPDQKPIDAYNAAIIDELDVAESFRLH